MAAALQSANHMFFLSHQLILPLLLGSVLIKPSWAAENALPTPLLFGVGERRTLPVRPGERVVVSRPKIINVVDRGSSLEVRGLRKGALALHVGGQSYSVLVSDTLPQGQILDSIKAMRDLSIAFENSSIVISGELWRLADWHKIAKLLAGSPFEFRARLDSEIETAARSYFYNQLRQRSLPLPILQMNFQQAISFGAVTQQEKDHLRGLFEPYGLKVSFDDKGFKLDPLVRIRVLVAELNHQVSSDWGLHWQNDFAPQLVPRFENYGGLRVELKALEQAGLAQILASPNLVCRSGGQADFLAGGEIPVRVHNIRQSQLLWRKHGVLLQMKPQVDPAGHVSLQMTIEVSIPQAEQIDGVPSLSTNRIQSEFTVSSGKTLALSGLLKNTLSESGNGWLHLRDIPILGSLFGSRSFRQSKSELMVFVTPAIETIDGASDAATVPRGWKDSDEPTTP